MAIKSGDELLYVSSNGAIQKVIAISDERNGAVDIQHFDEVFGKVIGPMGTFHLFRTMRAAEIAASQRSPK